MKFSSPLSASETTRKRLLVHRLEHVPAAHKPIRPTFIGHRQYLRALRAAEMRAWEAGTSFHAE